MSDGSCSLMLRDVSYGFPNRPNFLGPVTLEVNPGECWGIVGPNGAGKSTLLRLMGGLIRAQGGAVQLGGRALSQYSLRDRAKRIALVPQTVTGDPDLTGWETVLMGRYPHRSLGLFESSEDRRLTEEAQSLTGTTEFSNRAMGTLSGGEAQRVHLAGAFAQQASILLLDEPTASLDLRHQVSIFQLLRDSVRDFKLAVVVVTHDVNLASRFCTHVIVLDCGRVGAIGPPGEVLTPPLLSRVFGVVMVRTEDPNSGTSYLAPTSQGGA